MNQSFKRQLVTSVVCTAVFGFIVACGGGHKSMNDGMTSLAAARTILASTPILGGNLFAKSDGSRVNLAGFMFQTAVPVATTFAQSFHGQCSSGPGNNTNAVMYHQINGFGASECATSSGNISTSDRLLTESDISNAKSRRIGYRLRSVKQPDRSRRWQ
jgi:hypothetical protein